MNLNQCNPKLRERILKQIAREDGKEVARPVEPVEGKRLRLNPQLTTAAAHNAPQIGHYENHPNLEISNPIPKRDQASALGGATQGKAQSLRRARIRFIGYRVRPLDPDNFAGSVKDLLDGLRHAGLIPGDEPWRIILETEQIKVNHFTAERTEIIIDL